MICAGIAMLISQATALMIIVAIMHATIKHLVWPKHARTLINAMMRNVLIMENRVAMMSPTSVQTIYAPIGEVVLQLNVVVSMMSMMANAPISLIAEIMAVERILIVVVLMVAMVIKRTVRQIAIIMYVLIQVLAVPMMEDV